jgi:hypothetical protein
MSEESWDEIHKAHDKNQWATLLELSVQHLKQNPDHLWARIPQAIALTHLNHLERSGSVVAGDLRERECLTVLQVSMPA